MRLLFEVMAGDLFFLFEDFGYYIVESRLVPGKLMESSVSLYSATNNVRIKLCFDRDQVLLAVRSKHSLKDAWFDLDCMWAQLDKRKKLRTTIAGAASAEFLKTRLHELSEILSSSKHAETESAAQLIREARWE